MTQRSKRRDSQSASKRDATFPRTTKEREAAQEDPEGGSGAKTRGSHPPGAGVQHSGDDPHDGNVMLPLPADGSPLTHYKGTSLKNIGRDGKGQVISHKYSSKVARQISVWMLGGYSENDCAIALNMRPGLLRELYGKEIRHGVELMGMDMTQHIVARAKKSDNMARFVAKARMGWRDGDSKPIDTGILSIFIHS